MTSYSVSISFKINSEKSLGKASSFTKIRGILKEFPDLTLYMENILFLLFMDLIPLFIYCRLS